jgi:hypothetical protein
MTIAAIPASKFVSSLPSVLSAAGVPLSMNGIILQKDPSIPIGTVQGFGSAAAVSAWFGPASVHAQAAAIYFAGFTGAQQIPSELYFVQYNTTVVAGYMRGGSVAGLTLAQLQALSGTITVVIDGVSHTSAAINLASASSFTAAAALIQTGLQAGTPTTTATVTYDVLRQAFLITSGTTGSASSVGYGTDSSLSPDFNFTATLGAVLSAGAAIATPAGVMASIIAATQNWAAFTTLFDPDAGAPGGPLKLQFSLWASQQNGQYAYVPWDSDPTPSTSTNDAACFGALLTAAQYNGTIPLWGLDPTKAAFVLGAIASIDFTQEDGRIDFAYLGQAGLTPDVSSLTVYNNLVGNGYNCYCNVATRTAQFQFLQPGSMPGEWEWIDPYINQLYFNSQMQNDLLVYRTSIKWVPYTEAGYNGVRQALQGAIDQMGTFGAWTNNVDLSGAQDAEITAALSAGALATLENQGWYLSVTDPGATARNARASPNIYFYYTDGGNIQQFTVNAVDVE